MKSKRPKPITESRRLEMRNLEFLKRILTGLTKIKYLPDWQDALDIAFEPARALKSMRPAYTGAYLNDLLAN